LKKAMGGTWPKPHKVAIVAPYQANQKERARDNAKAHRKSSQKGSSGKKEADRDAKKKSESPGRLLSAVRI